MNLAEALFTDGMGEKIEIHEVPTGTMVFDWTIPREWNIRDAYIKSERGEKVVDFARSNLHVMSYSVPVRRRVSLDELKKHIHTLPEQPDLIPYRTSYYAENWAFCMAHRQFESLRDENYEVMIDSTLANEYLSYGEYLHKGELDDEVLFSAHVCHPSLGSCLPPARSVQSRGSRATKRKRSASSMGSLSPWSETVAARLTRRADVAMRRSIAPCSTPCVIPG
jgi:aminopeptidase-like protein